MKRFAALVLAPVLALVAGCHSSIKPLAQINSVENFCKQGVPKGPGIVSIIASIGDQMPAHTSETTKSVRAYYKKHNGAIAHWDHLEFYAPTAAKAAMNEEYLHITQAAIDDAREGATIRPVLLFMRGPQGEGWYKAGAYDLQNVCIEGARQS